MASLEGPRLSPGWHHGHPVSRPFWALGCLALLPYPSPAPGGHQVTPACPLISPNSVLLLQSMGPQSDWVTSADSQKTAGWMVHRSPLSPWARVCRLWFNGGQRDSCCFSAPLSQPCWSVCQMQEETETQAHACQEPASLARPQRGGQNFLKGLGPGILATAQAGLLTVTRILFVPLYLGGRDYMY